MATVGSLAVNVVANTAPFARGMATARAETKLFASAVGAAKGLVAGFGTALLAGFTIHGLRQTSEDMDKITKGASRLGIATESLSGLQFAAERSGASFESLQQALTIMEKNLGSGAAGKHLAEIGLRLEDVQQMKADQAFVAIAEKLSKIDNVAERTSATLGIFGRGGSELANLLMEGAGGIQALTDRAKELGLTFDEEMGKKAEEANDAMLDLTSSVKGLARELVATLGPAIAEMARGLADLIAAKDLISTPGETTSVFSSQYDALFKNMDDATFQKFQSEFKQFDKSDWKAKRRINPITGEWEGETLSSFVQGKTGVPTSEFEYSSFVTAMQKRQDAINAAVMERHKNAGIDVAFDEAQLSPMKPGDDVFKVGEQIMAQKAADAARAAQQERIYDAWQPAAGLISALGNLDTFGNAPPIEEAIRRAVGSGGSARGFSALEAGTAAAFSQERRSALASQEMEVPKQQLAEAKKQTEQLAKIDASVKQTQQLEIVNIA